jgi:hypothetical protein
LCRDVLNDLTGDGTAAFASWLRRGGVLVTDVHDWERTASR